MTRDFKLFYKLSLIDIPGITIKHVISLNEIPNNEMVISDINIPSISKLTVVNRNMSIMELKRRAIELLNQDQKDKMIYIGIDPGYHIGIAIVHLQSVIKTDIVLSVNSLVRWLRKELKQWKNEGIIIRIGNGIIHFTTKLIKRLKFEFDYVIELVDEQATSFKEINTKTIHEQAAIRIAGRKGIKQ